MKFHIESILANKCSDREKITMFKELLSRRSGTSTRLLNDYVEEFFQKGIVIVRDHFSSKQMDKDLAHKFMDRLTNEHGLQLADVKIVSTNPPTFEWIKFKDVVLYRQAIENEIEKLTKPIPV